MGDALPHEPGWAAPNATWAPSVLQRGSTFVLYYSAVYTPTGQQCISEAVATQPQGPYVDNSTLPLMCQTALGGSIDPTPFVDANGTPYLVWKSQGGSGQPPTLWSQQLTADGHRLGARDGHSTAWPRACRGRAASSRGRAWSWSVGSTCSSTQPTTGRRRRTPSAWPAAPDRWGRAPRRRPNRCWHRSPPSAGPVVRRCSPTRRGSCIWPSTPGSPGKVGFPNSRLLFIRQISMVGAVPSVVPEPVIGATASTIGHGV